MNNQLIRISLKLSDIIPPGLLSKLSPLRKNLAKSSMRIDFRVYTGLICFVTLITFGAAFGTFLLLLPRFHVSIPLTITFSLLIGILSGAFAASICYSYPTLVASSRRKNIDVSLSLTANYMAVLASAGMSPENIVTALAPVGEDLSISKEAGGIIRDIKIMGIDLYEALKHASESSPSPKFGTMLDGIITTSKMGGDLSGYLRDQADKFKRERMQNLRRFIDNLSVVAEAYVTFLVAAPLMLIVMLSVMSFMGGAVSFGNLDPMALLNILSLIVLPLGIAMMILAVDYLNPKR